MDVGEHMALDISSAIECLKLLLQRKVRSLANPIDALIFKFFAEKKEEVCLIFCGTETTSHHLTDDDSGTYSNVTLVRELAPLDWDILEFLNQETLLSAFEGDGMRISLPNLTRFRCLVMDAVAVGVSYLISKCKYVCSDKSIRIHFLLTGIGRVPSQSAYCLSAIFSALSIEPT